MCRRVFEESCRVWIWPAAAGVPYIAGDSGNGFFVSAFQRFAKNKNVPQGDNTTMTTKTNPTAFAIGYGWQGEAWRAGAALSYEHASRKATFFSPGLFTSSEVEYKFRDQTMGISLWAGRDFAAGWYVETSAFIGFRNLKEKSIVWNGVSLAGVSGDDDNNIRLAMSAEAGRRFDTVSGLVVTPHAGVDFPARPQRNGIPV